jgi:hypothetical protein
MKDKWKFEVIDRPTEPGAGSTLARVVARVFRSPVERSFLGGRTPGTTEAYGAALVVLVSG